ncbi:type I restriction-modification endonuclease subunit R [Bacillus sp. TS-2]|nr:type I restriction-modification endonuclease subunit R [Bacillus sp. TS-2]
MDLYARRIIGWAMDGRMNKELVIAALKRAMVAQPPQEGLIHHSDRGSQKYASSDYQAVLRKNKMVTSMSRKGNCIFYTNGFETYIWHEPYQPRKLSGFYDKDDLSLLMNRRTTERPLKDIQINDDISNRYYQKEAILSECYALTRNQRKALLVMATGSGKTRTAISLVDVLACHNWVKNVLFLAD